MAERIDKEEFVNHLAKKMKTDAETAEAWLDATLETMYQVFKSGKGISLPGFGGFYLDNRGGQHSIQIQPWAEAESIVRVVLYIQGQAVNGASLESPSRPKTSRLCH